MMQPSQRSGGMMMRTKILYRLATETYKTDNAFQLSANKAQIIAPPINS